MTTTPKAMIVALGLICGFDATAAPTCGTLALGETAECAVETGKGVRCVGTSEYGLLGKTTKEAKRPTVLAGVKNVDQISIGYDHGCVRAGTAVACWGYGELGQLGGGKNVSSSALVPVTSAPIADVDVGHVSSCARTTKGEVWCWGMIGTSPETNNVVPVQIALAGPAIDLDMGYADGCAVLVSGDVQCWSEATKLRSISGLPKARQVAVGWSYAPGACAVTDANEVWCWNLEWKKDPTVTATKVDVSDPAKQVVAGSAYTCALTTAGDVMCWGIVPGACASPSRTKGRAPATPPILVSPSSAAKLAFGTPITTLYSGPSLVCGQSKAGAVSCQGCRGTGETLAKPTPLPFKVAICK